MSEPLFSEKYFLAIVATPPPGPATYSLAAAAQLADVHPEMLRFYCRLGLFGAALAQSESQLLFDDAALFELRHFERYRRQHGVNRRTLRLIFGLRREVERLQAEVRFLRGP